MKKKKLPIQVGGKIPPKSHNFPPKKQKLAQAKNSSWASHKSSRIFEQGLFVDLLLVIWWLFVIAYKFALGFLSLFGGIFLFWAIGSFLCYLVFQTPALYYAANVEGKTSFYKDVSRTVSSQFSCGDEEVDDEDINIEETEENDEDRACLNEFWPIDLTIENRTFEDRFNTFWAYIFMTGSFGKKYFPDGLDFYRGISNSYYTVTYSYNDKLRRRAISQLYTDKEEATRKYHEPGPIRGRIYYREFDKKYVLIDSKQGLRQYTKERKARCLELFWLHLGMMIVILVGGIICGFKWRRAKLKPNSQNLMVNDVKA